MKNPNLTIEKARWDLRSTRIQFVSGAVLGMIFLVFCLHVFDANTLAPLTRLGSVSSISASMWLEDAGRTLPGIIDSRLAEIPLAITGVLGILLHAGTAIMVGLVCLDVDLRFGNRTGGGPAIWSSLLYFVYPAAMAILTASDGCRIALAVFLAISALYFDMRFRFLAEAWYQVLSLTLIALAALFDPLAAATGLSGIVLARLFLPSGIIKKTSIASEMAATIIPLLVLLAVTTLTGGLHPRLLLPETLAADRLLAPLLLTEPRRTITTLLNASALTVGILAITRVVSGTVWYGSIFFGVVWTTLTIVLASLVFAVPGSDSAAPHLLTAYYAAAPLTATVSLLALPATDTIRKGFAMAFAALGSLALGTLLVLWGLLCASEINALDHVDQSVTDFEREASLVVAGSRGPLLFVGLPASVEDYIDKVRNPANNRRARLEQFLDGITLGVTPGQVSFMTDFGQVDESRGPERDTVPKIFVWSEPEAQFRSIEYAGDSQLDCSFGAGSTVTIEPPVSELPRDTATSIDLNQPFIERAEGSLTVFPGVTELTVWLPAVSLNPAKIDRVEIEMEAQRMPGITPGVRLVFRGKPATETDEVTLSRPGNSGENSAVYVASVRNSASFRSNATIESIGIRVPAGLHCLKLRKLRVLPIEERR
ncbi:MAG: hypothetical protein KC777_17780 [Cyanobacteria bacterium HKST-UBA02]|nr:hypothetical protein [Cyanobacteria bacterium HKST-UBA02]